VLSCSQHEEWLAFIGQDLPLTSLNPRAEGQGSILIVTSFESFANQMSYGVLYMAVRSNSEIGDNELISASQPSPVGARRFTPPHHLTDPP